MQCYWSIIDPRDTMRLRGLGTVETETVLAVFVYRLYSQLLAHWSTLSPKDELWLGASPRENELGRVRELTRDLCESSDTWEMTVGRKFYNYLVYFVECVFERGLKRAEAESRRLASVNIFWQHTNGQVDIDSFF